VNREGGLQSHPVARRFRDHVAAAGGLREGDGVVVALSGGADSVTLLHLLRFTPGLPPLDLSAVHVDHRMRPESGDDARWVAGLCRAWGVPLAEALLDPVPRSEAEARRARYEALEARRREAGARWVVTAHHADDQAETVLFRALRGTGPAGLRGIRQRKAPGLWRPLLPFTRDELRGYAQAHRLTWREDPSNALLLARNVIRHRILPEAVAGVAAGARKALAGLARRAAMDEAALRRLEGEVLQASGLRRERGGWSVDAAAVAGRPPAVRARLVRALARRLGCVPGEAGTRRAVEFTSSGRSGGAVPLGSGVTLRRELERLLVVRDAPRTEDAALVLDPRAGGRGEVVIGGARYRVAWVGVGAGADEPDGSAPGTAARFPIRGLAVPLLVRGWLPGDRVRLAYGSKKMKKVFLERGVPPGERSRFPVLVDALGHVLWVPGVVRAAEAAPAEDEETLTIGITHAESD
jgi:tRNA(Ile)-lysidine synthase